MSSYNMQDTPFGYTLSVIGGKWKMVIMFVIVEKSVARYGEIKRGHYIAFDATCFAPFICDAFTAKRRRFARYPRNAGACGYFDDTDLHAFIRRK